MNTDKKSESIKLMSIKLPPYLREELRRASAIYLARGEQSPTLGEFLTDAWNCYKMSADFGVVRNLKNSDDSLIGPDAGDKIRQIEADLAHLAALFNDLRGELQLAHEAHAHPHQHPAEADPDVRAVAEDARDHARRLMGSTAPHKLRA